MRKGFLLFGTFIFVVADAGEVFIKKLLTIGVDARGQGLRRIGKLPGGLFIELVVEFVLNTVGALQGVHTGADTAAGTADGKVARML